jgi:hypothetical protein
VRFNEALSRRFCSALVLIGALAGDAWTQENGDFSLAMEQAGDTVLVVGSWKVDGVQGWSWGICHDPAVAVIGDCAGNGASALDPCGGGYCSAIACPDDVATAGPGGAGPAFHSVNVHEDGITQGVVLDLDATQTLAATDRFELLAITYTVTAPVAGVELAFCDDLGPPPIRTVFGLKGRSVVPLTAGLILRRGWFLRGNTDADQTITIGDAVFTLTHLFASGTAPSCLDAADTNDDGSLNLADAVFTLAYLFASGSAPPAPLGNCGPDPTPDDLDCLEFAPCVLAGE